MQKPLLEKRAGEGNTEPRRTKAKSLPLRDEEEMCTSTPKSNSPPAAGSAFLEADHQEVIRDLGINSRLTLQQESQAQGKERYRGIHALIWSIEQGFAVNPGRTNLRYVGPVPDDGYTVRDLEQVLPGELAYYDPNKDSPPRNYALETGSQGSTSVEVGASSGKQKQRLEVERVRREQRTWQKTQRLEKFKDRYWYEMRRSQEGGEEVPGTVTLERRYREPAGRIFRRNLPGREPRPLGRNARRSLPELSQAAPVLVLRKTGTNGSMQADSGAKKEKGGRHSSPRGKSNHGEGSRTKMLSPRGPTETREKEPLSPPERSFIQQELDRELTQEQKESLKSRSFQEKQQAGTSKTTGSRNLGVDVGELGGVENQPPKRGKARRKTGQEIPSISITPEEMRPSIPSSQNSAALLTKEAKGYINTIKRSRGMVDPVPPDPTGSFIEKVHEEPPVVNIDEEVVELPSGNEREESARSSNSESQYKKQTRRLAREIRARRSRGQARRCQDDTVCQLEDCPGTPNSLLVGDVQAAIPGKDKGAPGTGEPCPKHHVVHEVRDSCDHFDYRGKRIRHRQRREGLRKATEIVRRRMQQDIQQPAVLAVASQGPFANSSTTSHEARAGMYDPLIQRVELPGEEQERWLEPAEERSTPRKDVPWNVSRRGWKVPNFEGSRMDISLIDLWIDRWRSLAREKGLEGRDAAWTLMELIVDPALERLRRRLGGDMRGIEDPEVIIGELRRMYDTKESHRRALEEFKNRIQRGKESTRDYMEALIALHRETDAGASVMGLNHAVRIRFLEGLRDPTLTNAMVRHNIAACVARLDEEDEDYLEAVVREVEAQRLAARQIPPEASAQSFRRRKPSEVENRPLKTIEELPESDELREDEDICSSDEAEWLDDPERLEIARVMQVAKVLQKGETAPACFHCGEFGHFRRLCPNKDQPQTSKARTAQTSFSLEREERRLAREKAEMRSSPDDEVKPQSATVKACELRQRESDEDEPLMGDEFVLYDFQVPAEEATPKEEPCGSSQSKN